MQDKKNNEVSLMDLIAKDPRLTKLNEVIKVTDLTGRLSGKDGLTLFAPTNEAFANASPDRLAQLMRPENRAQLKQLLLLHILPKPVSVDDMKKAGQVRSETGVALPVNVSAEKNEISLGAAKIVPPTQEAKNGYLYPTDHFLQPTATSASARA